MPAELVLLVTTTAGIALAHTLLGPDHYVPFIAMFRAGQWTRSRAMRITLLCGLGHIAASIGLGLIGVAVGASMSHWVELDSLRSSLAAWTLILFGLGYGAWGLRRGLRGGEHSHRHAHADGIVHDHAHPHRAEHVHVHSPSRVEATTPSRIGAITKWTLFAAFVLGPCEPLIPLLLVPAAAGSPGHIATVAAVYTVVTLAAMLGIVGIATAGWGSARAFPKWRFGHAVAGAMVGVCGLMMEFAGF
jgi:ABC-type nickel/cobalt efflux system permease component RcnA